jgi:hypothetical protein
MTEPEHDYGPECDDEPKLTEEEWEAVAALSAEEQDED